MRAVIFVVGLLVAIAVGGYLWTRTRSRDAAIELKISSGASMSRTLEVGFDVPDARLREVILDLITRQLPEKLPSVASKILSATVCATRERDMLELSEYMLFYDPGPPAGWHQLGDMPIPRERALDGLVDSLLRKIEMERLLRAP